MRASNWGPNMKTSSTISQVLLLYLSKQLRFRALRHRCKRDGTGNYSQLPVSFEGEIHLTSGGECNDLAEWAQGRCLAPELSKHVAPKLRILEAGRSKEGEGFDAWSQRIVSCSIFVRMSSIQPKRASIAAARPSGLLLLYPPGTTCHTCAFCRPSSSDQE